MMRKKIRARLGYGPSPLVVEMTNAFQANVRGGEYGAIFFDHHIPNWIGHLDSLGRERALAILEIGSYEGRSAVFLLTFFPHAFLTAVDTWEGSDEHTGEASRTLDSRFDHNLRHFEGRYRKLRGYSFQRLAEMQAEEEERYDLIYVDASHYADDVMVDAILSWKLLKVGGVMILDDFLWFYYGRRKNPAKAIIMFLNLLKGQHRIIYAGMQVFIEKTVSDRSLRPRQDAA